jgi:hypothetical protein
LKMVAVTSRSRVFTGERRRNDDAECGVALVVLLGCLVYATLTLLILYLVPCIRNVLALADWDSLCVPPCWRLPHLLAAQTNPSNGLGLRLGLRPLGIVGLGVCCSLHHHREDIHPGPGCLLKRVRCTGAVGSWEGSWRSTRQDFAHLLCW